MSNPDSKDLPVCPTCGEIMIVEDSGTYKNKVWYEFKCEECGFWFTEEPDYE